jgi:hypothetical protein
MEWKWSNGKSYKKSKRVSENNTSEELFIQQEKEDFLNKKNEDTAYSISLNHDENTWDILNQGLYNGFEKTSKRETLDSKIANRELVQQTGFNPFLNDSNYVQDIEVSNLFLKPINTTQEKEKEKSNE